MIALERRRYTLLLYFFCVSLYSNLGEVPQLTNDVLGIPYTGRPICAYFKHAGTSPDYEELLSKFLRSEVAINYEEWTTGSVKIEDINQMSPPPNLYPSRVPSLQCDIGLQIPLEYMFQKKSLKSLKKWFKHVLRKHTSQPKFVTTVQELENAIFDNHKGITMLMIAAEMEYFYSIRGLLKKDVRDYQMDMPINVLITWPKYVEYCSLNASIVTISVDLHSFLDYYVFGRDFYIKKQMKSFNKLEMYPAVLFFTYEVWATEKSFVYVLQGQHEVSSNSIQLALMAVADKFVFMDKERFLHEVLDTTYQLPPKLVFVFSYLNQDSLKHFLKFNKIRKQLDCEGVPLEFRLMDIGKRNNSRVFSRHINGTKIKMFPVFVLFWQELATTYEIKLRQEVLNDVSTADGVFLVLVKNGVLDKWKRNYDHCIEESDDQNKECVNLASHPGVCIANTTTMVNQDYSVNYPTPRIRERKRNKTKPRKNGNLTVLTDNDWSAAIEASSLSTSTKRLQRINDSPLISLVFFIIKKCRYCEIIMPQIQKLAQTIRSSAKAPVYLVNCSFSPTICKRQNVQGFPSLKLFRSLPWSNLDGCVTDHIERPYVTLDYHRPLEPFNLILEWFSNSSLPNVKKDFLLSSVPKQLNHDVYLVGSVITRSQALRFLPAHTHNKWYSYTCFQTACELLFGKATCYVTMTRDFGVSQDMRKTKNKDLFLIKVELFRSDGVKATIFELGVPLETTIRSEQDSALHKFHNSHSYYFERGLRCEDNHLQCTEFIVNFVRDHSRLPVTQLSHDGFHTINRLLSDGAGPSKEMPVVVILAHKSNMTKNSSYTQEIIKAAYELYRDVVFTSLDVDEYPWWARQFVPRNYDTTQLSGLSDLAYTPPLYHYPRLCLVKMSDHHQAAFLPSLESMASAKNITKLLASMNAKEIVQFIKRYSQNPEHFLVKTEEF